MGFKKGIKKGMYEPVFPEKWIVTETFDVKGKGIKYRSSWEHKFMRFADFNPDIVRVNSEGVVVPYFNPVKGKVSRYYIDFLIQNKKGKVFLVEIKPLSEVNPPKPPRSKTKKSMISYQKAVETYVVNMAKWEAAKKYADEHNVEFIIITERELGV